MQHRVLVPLVTPLDEAGAVCRRSVAQLMSCLRETASGYIPCLSSGEGWLLDGARWEAMVRCTLELADPGVVIAGIERATTEQAVEAARRAKWLGATAVMLTPPFGADVDARRTLAHYRAVHDLGGLDIYLYNESRLSGHVAAFETLLSVAELPRVMGIKDSVSGGRERSQIAALRSRGVAYYVGWEHQLANGLPVDGCVVALANLEPALCRLGLASAEPAVRAEIHRLTELYSLFDDDWFRRIKRVLRARGVITSERTLTS
jgi:4-hydroxy-tetrahydrodipicolinate synthase